MDTTFIIYCVVAGTLLFILLFCIVQLRKFKDELIKQSLQLTTHRRIIDTILKRGNMTYEEFIEKNNNE